MAYQARLGDFTFQLSTASFQELQHRAQYDWQSQARIGGGPAKQFVGMGEDTFALTGTIFPHFRGGLGQMAKIREQAGKGKPLPFVYAMEREGQYVGDYVIESVEERRQTFLAGGQPLRIDFTIQLSRYWDKKK